MILSSIFFQKENLQTCPSGHDIRRFLCRSETRAQSITLPTGTASAGVNSQSHRHEGSAAITQFLLLKHDSQRRRRGVSVLGNARLAAPLARSGWPSTRCRFAGPSGPSLHHQRGGREVESKALNPIIETVETSDGFPACRLAPPMNGHYPRASGRSVGSETLEPQHSEIWTCGQRLFSPRLSLYDKCAGPIFTVRVEKPRSSDCGITSLATWCSAAVSL